MRTRYCIGQRDRHVHDNDPSVVVREGNMIALSLVGKVLPLPGFQGY